jgi:hypothetical protein
MPSHVHQGLNYERIQPFGGEIPSRDASKVQLVDIDAVPIFSAPL